MTWFSDTNKLHSSSRISKARRISSISKWMLPKDMQLPKRCGVTAKFLWRYIENKINQVFAFCFVCSLFTIRFNFAAEMPEQWILSNHFHHESFRFTLSCKFLFPNVIIDYYLAFFINALLLYTYNIAEKTLYFYV